MFFSEKRLVGQVSRLLALGSLMLCAVAVLKYSSSQCEFQDLGQDSIDQGNQYCKDQLYESIRLPRRGNVSCSQLVRGDPEAIQEALLSRLQRKADGDHLQEGHYINMTKDCELFRSSRKYIEFPLSKEEEEFPIAYSIVIHDKVEMFERLLRAIYTPQNVYCVHVDAKSPQPLQEAVRRIASCFGNVFLASKQERVVYASWNRVQADLNCMEDLLRSQVKWQYLLNTCGTDLPIKTNAEIVRSLKVLDGRNNMEAEKPSEYKAGRWKYHHDVTDSVVRTQTEKSPPPQSSPMFTGNAYVILSRGFVQYLFQDPMVKQFIEWSKDTYSPDEHIWATLHRMPGVPGGVPFNSKFDLTDMNAIARLVKWSYSEGDIAKGAPYPPCTGVHRRAVCTYGAGDLHWMLSQHHLFANKFDSQVDNTVIECLEEYLRYKSIHGKTL
nr:beta-1,3-galactosyl-O-glycosyl-glycoprotein beta-1,6-N-acetylglucosaminyltransferase 3 [Anolis sagrei ordinatus]